MTYQAIQTLPNTPLDIIGDVHGEFAALQALLHHLGYDATGYHPEGRTLVFVGDLCDRGPDSPAVLAWFKQAYDAGYALMVLGNHELNLLVGEAKDGSGWFFDERLAQETHYAPWQRMPESEKADLIAWLSTMPLVLQREDVRIVHAAWLPEALAQLSITQTHGIITAYQQWDSELKQRLHHTDWYADYLAEEQQHFDALSDAHTPPHFMHNIARFEWERSRAHPIRALTSGTEKIVDKPFYAGGRWRFTGRCRWWEDYQDEVAVVVGHYWRHWYPEDANDPLRDTFLFHGANNAWLGAKRNVFCIDYSVGARWRDRQAQAVVAPEHSRFRLAALRWTEKTLVFDDGSVAETQ